MPVPTPKGGTDAPAATTLHVFPSAPAASASWLVCSTFQLHLAGPWTGVIIGLLMSAARSSWDLLVKVGEERRVAPGAG